MNRAKLMGVVVGIGALATACGKPAAKATLDQSNSQLAGKTLGATVEASAMDLKGGPGAAAAAGCYTVSGDTSDPDGDGIPSNATVLFDNCTVSSTAGTAVLNGKLHVQDDDNSSASFNFLGDSALILVETDPAGDSATIKRVGGIQGIEPANASSFELKHAVGTEITAQSEGVSHDLTEKYGFDEGYAPSSSWAPGQALVAGEYALAGAYDITVDDQEAKAAVVTAQPLQLDPTCSTLIVGGEVDAGFAGPNDKRLLKVVWSGCDQKTVLYVEQAN